MKTNLMVPAAAILLATTAPMADLKAQSISDGQYYAGAFFTANSFASDMTDYNFSNIIFLDYDPVGYGYGVVVGRGFANNLRGELELSSWVNSAECRFKCKIGSGSYDTTAIQVLGNVWLDIPNDSEITPYVGGGIGYMDYSANTPFGGSVNLSGIAGQIGAGFQYEITSKAILDVGYRYKTAQLEYDSGPAASFYDEQVGTHFIQIGFLAPF